MFWHLLLGGHGYRPVNTTSGFRKCGIYALNPGQIDDRQIAPFKVFSESAEKPSTENSAFEFTEEQKLDKV